MRTLRVVRACAVCAAAAGQQFAGSKQSQRAFATQIVDRTTSLSDGSVDEQVANLVAQVQPLTQQAMRQQEAVLQEQEAVRDLAVLRNADLQGMVELQGQLLAAQIPRDVCRCQVQRKASNTHLSNATVRSTGAQVRQLLGRSIKLNEGSA